MIINYLVPHLKVSGGMRVNFVFSNLLVGSGHKVNIIVISPSWARRTLGNFIRLKPRWFGKLGAEIIRVPAIKDEYVPDAHVCIADSWKVMEKAALLSESKGRKLHLIQHLESLYHGEKEKVEEVYNLPLKKLVVSHWLKDEIESKFGYEAEVITPPIDTEIFYPAGTSLKKEGEIRVLMLHHEAEWKGVKIGQEAFKRVKKAYPNMELAMFGAKHKRKPMGVDEYHYNPSQDELAKLYSSCDIYLCSSEYEGLGLPGMEAMACKSALVTFDTGGSREYAIDGQTAFVAEHNNIDDLTDKLRKAVENHESRKRVSESGYQFVRSHFTKEKTIKSLESVIKQIR